MEVKEYVSYFRNLQDQSYHSHRLSYEQVMDNEFRKHIIENVLQNPGIQYNSLRKECNLHPGQFRWHCGILIDYGVICKQKIGQNVIFSPVNSDPTLNFDRILHFPLREAIFQLILESPGLISSEIARNLKIPHRNKIKYHIDKLIAAKYITIIQNGRRKEIFPSS